MERVSFFESRRSGAIGANPIAMNDDSADSNKAGWRFDNSYARLPEVLFAKQNPEPVARPGLALLNRGLAESMGLDADALESDAEIFAGNALPPGAEPIAQAYAGHQFGHFTMLGDGRAVLLGEHLSPRGERWDVQLKGSGRTPFSRRGDGRAALGPMLREYIVSEAMHGLGIPTTRSLAVATTGEAVYRDSALPGAVLTRIAASHIRVGTFEYVAATGNGDALRALADHVLKRHYPELASAAEPHRALLEAVVARQAELIARWMLVGFVHGVMNTDNMALSGETIDYGPCAFLDVYDPETVFSSIDRQSRYAYGNQPRIANWNLVRLAEAFLPLLDADETRGIEIAKEVLGIFPERFESAWLAGMRAKLGLFDAEPGDLELARGFLEWMARERRDFTNSFRDLDPSKDSAEGGPWHLEWKARLERQGRPLEEVRELLRRSNPAVIARNHRVEEALEAAVEHGDLEPARRLVAVLRDPFADAPEKAVYREPAPAGGLPYVTYCGT
jgi:serine/tyrosine/threonine adenylyltransferase